MVIMDVLARVLCFGIVWRQRKELDDRLTWSYSWTLAIRRDLVDTDWGSTSTTDLDLQNIPYNTQHTASNSMGGMPRDYMYVLRHAVARATVSASDIQCISSVTGQMKVLH